MKDGRLFFCGNNEFRKASIYKPHITRNKSVTKKIIEESKHHEAIMLGATENRFKKILFGSITNVIAKESLKTVVLVKKGEK